MNLWGTLVRDNGWMLSKALKERLLVGKVIKKVENGFQKVGNGFQ